MLNHAPIFVNGFARGGTNLLMNLLASHPDVCLLSDGETHFVFHGKQEERFKKWLHRGVYLPVLVGTRQHLFRPGRFGERKPVSRLTMRYIDAMLFADKMTTSKNRRKGEHGVRSLGEMARGRLLCKNINGVVFASQLLATTYPEATFFGFVRNGLALCEGYIRRGGSAERFGKMYEQVCQKMISDSQRMPRYHMICFEDLMADPVGFIEQLYRSAGLNLSQVQRFRLQAKESMDKDGVRRHTLGTESWGAIRWFDIGELSGRFRPDVNDNQIARLSETDKATFLRHAGRSMEYFGYLESSASPAGRV